VAHLLEHGLEPPCPIAGQAQPALVGGPMLAAPSSGEDAARTGSSAVPCARSANA
jgi:hypothetical protein